MELWEYVGIAIAVAALIWAVSRAVIATYFKAKEEFVERLIKRNQPRGRE